jgi:6-phosphogluconolactonase (cycloisomerase 2 family)
LNSVRSATVSPDGKHVYAAGTYDNAIAIFCRDSNTGLLTFVDAVINDQNGVDGLASPTFVTVSPDASHVYAAGSQDSAIAVFSRDAITGRLTFVEAIKNGQGKIHGLGGVCAIAFSHDGDYLYATSWADNALVSFTRDKATGRLAFNEVLLDKQQGVDGLDGAVSVSVNPNGKYLCTAAALDNKVAVFKIESPQYIALALGEKLKGVNVGIHKRIRTDMNSDSRVNMVDFAVFASRWGGTECQSISWCDGADFDHNDSVNLADLAAMATEWLQSDVELH